MKKILSLMVFLPLISFSQISHWRSGNYNSNSVPRVSIPQVQTHGNSISQWRYTPPVPQSPRVYVQPSYRSYRYLSPYPYMGLYGYYYSSPYYWYDPYGYRIRGYVYHYENGKVDTVQGQPIHLNLGIQFSNNMLGGYMTIGNEGYFIAEIINSISTPNTTYYPYGNLSQVDFPLIGDEHKMRIFYFGGGKMISHTTGYHVELGFGNEQVNYRGKDALGYITFPKYSQNFVTAKVGMLHNYKNFGLKLDVDPVKGIFTAGLGVRL